MAPKPTFNYSWQDIDDGELTPIESSDEEPDPEPDFPAPSSVAPTPKIREVHTKATRPSTQQATKQSRDRIAAKSSPYLRSPRTTTYSLSSLHEMMTSGTIDLDPEYQRAVVWTTSKQEGLIDSFYHNFYVPPIIFATTTREQDGVVIRTCIDGKQRLTSMRLFMDGELSHKDSLKGNRSWFINPKGSKRRLISPQWQSKFKQTQIACVEYDDITEEQQREIFQRVQMGVTLTPADRLQSANGPIADLIREVRARVNSTEGLEGYLDWGKARGKDFKTLAEIAYLITNAKRTRSNPTILRLEAFLDNKPHSVSAAKSREEFLTKLRPVMPNVMDIFCRILQHSELGEPLRENMTPVEFVMSAYIIYVYRKSLSDTQLSHAIAYMRQEAQRSFDDMKVDSVKRKHLLTFIHKTMPRLIPKLKSDGHRDVPAFQVPCQRVESKFGDRFKNKVEGTSAKPATKRKRNGSEDEEDEADNDDESLMIKKPNLKPKRSSSASDFENKQGRPRAPTSGPSLNTSRASAPVSKAQTAVKRTKQQSTLSQTSDVKKPVQVPSMTASKSEGLQVATSKVEPSLKSSTKMGGPSQRVMSKLGPQLFEPIALGRRAEAARAALNQPASPVISVRETQMAPSPNAISQNSNGNSPVVRQSTLSRTAPSSSSGSVSGSVLSPDASTNSRMTGSANNSFTRVTRVGPDRLAPIRGAKAAASSGSLTMAGIPQVSRSGSVNSPTDAPVSAQTSSTTVDADMEWQMAFADLLPAQRRITEESTAMVSSKVLAPSTDVRMHDAPRSTDGSRRHRNSARPTPTPTPTPSNIFSPSIRPNGWS